MLSYSDIVKRPTPGPRTNTPLIAPHPTPLFLELYRKLRNPSPVQEYQANGRKPMSMYIFQGVLNGDYTSGCAMALASTKEDAIDQILEEIKKTKEKQELLSVFLKEIQASYDIVDNNWKKSTGWHYEEWIDMVYKDPVYSVFGTWRGSVNEAREELMESTPAVIDLSKPYAFVSGGGD